MHNDPALASANAPSTLSVPVRISAAFLQRTLDEVLDGLRPEDGLLYRLDDLDLGGGLVATVNVWRRGNSSVTLAADCIDATLPVRVTLQPAWRPHLGPLELPEGMGLDLPLALSADYTVRMRAHPQLDAHYNLRLHALFDHGIDRPMGLEYHGIGLTFAGQTRRAAEQALTALGNWLNSEEFHYLNFRDRVERGWLALQQPFALSPGHQVQLELQPHRVCAHPFRTDGADGLLGLDIVAQVRVVAADAHSRTPVPLPDLSLGDAAAGVALVLPLTVTFAALEAALRENVAHQPWHIDGRQVVLREVHVSGSTSGELDVSAEVSVLRPGHDTEVEAHLAAGGRPRLDVDAQHLVLEDFHYDVHTDSTLLNLAAGLLRPFAGAILEPWLNLPLLPPAERLLAETNARLHDGIRLADDFFLHGRVDGIQLTGLVVNADGLGVALATHGQLSVQTRATTDSAADTATNTAV